MSIDSEVLDLTKAAVVSTLKEGLNDYLKGNLFGWNSPLSPLIKDAMSKVESLPALLKEATDEVVAEPEFKTELKTALRKRLVNELVKSFSLENTLKELRNNPASKQRILEALEDIAKP